MKKIYKGIFIDRFTKKNKPVNYKLFKSVKEIAAQVNFDIEPIEVTRGELHEKLIKDILNADVVISCMSRSKTKVKKHDLYEYENVVFETAMRQTFRKPIIIVCSKSKDIDKLPFYLKYCVVIEHKEKEKFKKALEECINKPDTPDNRIWDIINRIEEDKNKRMSKTFEIWPINELWKIGPANSINVRVSYLGGFATQGMDWETYKLKFKMKILNRCLGVIIRGIPFYQGLMLQFSAKGLIRPHRYVRVLDQTFFHFPSEIISIEKLNLYANIQENYWYDVEIEVNENIKIKIINLENQNESKTYSWDKEAEIKLLLGNIKLIDINDKLVDSKYLKQELDELKCGTIGFRNAGEEEALVRDIEVGIIEPYKRDFQLWSDNS